MVHEGDLVEIPLPDGRTAIGWILHISKLFKSMIGFVVFGIKGQVREDVEHDLEIGDLSSMKVLGPFYTNEDAITHYGWMTFANHKISPGKRQLTKRLVGSNVYVGDECIREATLPDQSTLKPMLSMGMVAVYQHIERAFGNGRVAPLTE